MRLTFFTVFTALMLIANQAHAGIVTFGSGTNSFDMEFVTIGDVGNAADTTGSPNPAGAVSYEYQMGKYEVSRGMIEAYNAIYGTPNSRVITMQTAYGPLNAERAASGISWNEAARFVNWLNTSQGYSAAYKFETNGVSDNISLWSVGDTGYDASNPYRNSGAKYVLPTVDEWYKAAYYDPATSSWRQYASLDGSLPTAVSKGTDDNTAVYGQSQSSGPAEIYGAGGLNAYGIMAMNGNVWEWQETSLDLTNSSGDLSRIYRGGYWSGTAARLASSFSAGGPTTSESSVGGFRVAVVSPVSSSTSSSTGTVPEPTTFAIWGVMGLAGFGGIRRRRNRTQQDEPSQVSES